MIDRERWRRDGLLFPIPVLTPAEVAALRGHVDELERLCGGRIREESTKYLHLFHPWFHALALHPRLLDIVEELIGPDILVHSSSLFCKYPDSRSYVSWHQDGHYWGLEPAELLAVWIALTPSNLETGCMQAIPRSHARALAHEERPDPGKNMLSSGLTIAGVDASAAVPVILEPGQISIHHVNTIHGSSVNRGPDRRIGCVIRYVTPAVTQRSPHRPAVLARGDATGTAYALLETAPTASPPVVGRREPW